MDPNTKFCIIGGGPAGLSAAMYLEQKGYTQYAVLEKSDHVGGKCNSPTFNGKRYEMGAIMGAPSYFAVHDVEKFCGITHDGPTLERKYKNMKGDEIDPYNPKKNLLRIPHLMQMKNQMKKFASILETKYKGYDVNGHRGVAEGKYDGYTATEERAHTAGDNPNLKDLALPFRDFCKLNGVEFAQEVWIGPYTSFGYGYFDEIPAGYVIKYLDFKTLMYFINMDLWTWKEGTQSIWEHLNEKLQHQARLYSNITKVERRDNKVYVTVNGETEEFDKIIITAPLQFMPDYFDATADEKALFSKIDYERYDVLAVTTKPEDHPDISYYIFENMRKDRLGHLMVYYDRWREDLDQVIVTYALRKHKDGQELPSDKVRETVLEDLKTMHNPAKDVVNEEHWYYFPHVFSEDYAAGWYDKVEAMQGKNNTYYAGEVMSFGDMEETAEYSRELVERFF